MGSYLRVGHLNARSLFAHLNEVRHVISSHNFDIFAVSETHLDNTIPDDYMMIDGYDFIRYDRNRDGGGVGIYLRSCFKFNVLEMGVEIEQIWIRITLRGANIALGVVYKPPSSSYVNFINAFETTVSHILPTVDDIFCLGDFNIDLLKPDTIEARRVTAALDGLGLHQVVNHATRITEDTATMIDYILTTDPRRVSDVSVSPISSEVSDHDLIYCEIRYLSKKPPPRYKTARDFKHLNYTRFSDDLKSIPWNNIYDIDDIDGKVTFLNNNIIALLDIHAPFKTYKITKKYAPWLTDTLREMMRLRDDALKRCRRTKTHVDWQNYKDLRNIVSTAVKREKKAYYNTKINSCPSNLLWSHLKTVNLVPSKNAMLPHQLSDVEQINNNFVQSVPRLPLNNALELFYNSNIKSNVTSFLNFVEVSEIQVLSIISSIKSKATGHDGIGISTISLCIPHILTHLTHVINFCIRHSVFPEGWKKAHVIPIPKTSKPNSYGDIRPISILPTLSKVLEKILQKQLDDHLLKNKIIPATQSGFRRGYSCCTSLLNITDDIFAATDQGKLTMLILLDYSKAFDTLNHDLLKSILHYIGTSDGALALLSCFLNNRSQAVAYCGRRSSFKGLACGVPQGSILAPTLFSTYISSFASICVSCTSHYYADDSQLLLSFYPSESEQAVAAVNFDLAKIYEVSTQHCLILNGSKSVFVLFGRKKDRIAFQRLNYRIEINAEGISQQSAVKNLGLTMDEDLRFTKHISNCLKKAYFGLRTIYQHRQYLSRRNKIKLCETLVLSHLNYCDVVYNSSIYSADIGRIQKLQNGCLRLIFGIRKYSHISHTFYDINWLNMLNRRRLHAATLFFKVISHKAPQYLYQRITFRSDVHTLNLRFRGTLTPPSHKTELYKRSFSYTITKCMNSISVSTNHKCPSKFKKDYFSFLISEQFSGQPPPAS